MPADPRKLDRWKWLLDRLNRPPLRRFVSDRAYYRVLDLLCDNQGRRPLSMRQGLR
jgi:hypothetical protein